MNALDLIKNGTLALKENKISSHRIDSEILLSSVLGKSREEMLINLDEKSMKKLKVNFFQHYQILRINIYKRNKLIELISLNE